MKKQPQAADITHHLHSSVSCSASAPQQSSIWLCLVAAERKLSRIRFSLQLQWPEQKGNGCGQGFRNLFSVLHAPMWRPLNPDTAAANVASQALEALAHGRLLGCPKSMVQSEIKTQAHSRAPFFACVVAVLCTTGPYCPSFRSKSQHHKSAHKLAFWNRHQTKALACKLR